MMRFATLAVLRQLFALVLGLALAFGPTLHASAMAAHLPEAPVATHHHSHDRNQVSQHDMAAHHKQSSKDKDCSKSCCDMGCFDVASLIQRSAVHMPQPSVAVHLAAAQSELIPQAIPALKRPPRA